MTNMIDDLFERWSAEIPVAGALDFLEDRTDDMLEAAARSVRLVRAGSSEIKENGLRATPRASGGARTLVDALGAVQEHTHPSRSISLGTAPAPSSSPPSPITLAPTGGKATRFEERASAWPSTR